MYSNQSHSQSSSSSGYPPELSNNPFILPEDKNASSRWPDISHEVNQSQGRSQQQQWSGAYESDASRRLRNSNKFWMDSSDGFPGGGNWPPPPVAQPSWPQTSQPQYSYQPQQQVASNTISPQTTGYSIPQSYTGNYQSFQAPLQVSSQYDASGLYSGYTDPNVSQFDPYSNPQAQSWGTPSGQSGSYNPNQYSSTGSLPSSYAPSHPRDFIRENKLLLEAWDPYSWKQALNSIETLKGTWETRLSQLQTQLRQQQSQGYGYIDPGMDPAIRSTQACIDSTVASYFQMKEVYDGYKLSTDEASRKRVREALNAGLTSLPDWPQ